MNTPTDERPIAVNFQNGERLVLPEDYKTNEVVGRYHVFRSMFSSIGYRIEDVTFIQRI